MIPFIGLIVGAILLISSPFLKKALTNTSKNQKLGKVLFYVGATLILSWLALVFLVIATHNS